MLRRVDPRPTRRLLAVLACVSLAAGACSSDSDEASPDDPDADFTTSSFQRVEPPDLLTDPGKATSCEAESVTVEGPVAPRPIDAAEQFAAAELDIADLPGFSVVEQDEGVAYLYRSDDDDAESRTTGGVIGVREVDDGWQVSAYALCDGFPATPVSDAGTGDDAQDDADDDSEEDTSDEGGDAETGTATTTSEA